MTSVPETPVKKKVDRMTEVVNTLIGSMMIWRAALEKLQREKRGTPALYFKLQIESNLVADLLRKVFKLDPDYVARTISELSKDPDFVKSVQEYCDNLTPPPKILITPEEFERELRNVTRR